MTGISKLFGFKWDLSLLRGVLSSVRMSWLLPVSLVPVMTQSFHLSFDVKW